MTPDPTMRLHRKTGQLALVVALTGSLLTGVQLSQAQDNGGFGDFEEEYSLTTSAPLCFGTTGITNTRALEICDALYLDRNVRARELAQNWLAQEPESPGAHFALAEVLSRVEGNLPRALYHLNQAEALTNYTSLGRALESGNLEWHYLTLNQLSYLHQLIGNQEEALLYLDRIRDIYGQDTESFRGWPLIKLKRYDEARASAEHVLANSNDRFQRSRAWNTLCAVELADLRPLDSLAACENAMSEDENSSLLENATSSDTVHLLNASEVSLSLLRFDEAERYLDVAMRFLNADSVGNPWVYGLYIYMNQGRFDEAREALDNMLIWRNNQTPMVTVMNRAEHLMVSAMFLLLSGYPEDAARLTRSALNQPDRTGSYSADEAQKDSVAALVNRSAQLTAYQMKREEIASMGWWESIPHRIEARLLRFHAWRSGRQAASLFADRDTLMNRLRPYAPLDVHIPEWVEPDMVAILGPGMLEQLLDETREAGAFSLNDGYYHAWRVEILHERGRDEALIESARLALATLPAEEVLLRTRISAHLAEAAWRQGDRVLALEHYEAAVRQDPSILRRLGARLPVRIDSDNSAFASSLQRPLQRSPRFRVGDQGLIIEVQDAGGRARICLRSRDGDSLSCVAPEADDASPDDEAIAILMRRFHQASFSLDYDMSRGERLALLGGSVIGSNRGRARQEQIRDSLLQEVDPD